MGTEDRGQRTEAPKREGSGETNFALG
jgi:hypothetical protein